MPRSDFPNLPEKPQVPLVGEDGNAMAIMGRVCQALRRSGHPKALIDAYTTEAMSGDYNNLLCVTLDYVDERHSEHDDASDDDRYECGGCGTELDGYSEPPAYCNECEDDDE